MTPRECIDTLIKIANWNYFSKEATEALKYATVKLTEDQMKLAPCKKCGERAGRTIFYSTTRWRCSCGNCGYATKLKESMDDAIFAWNQQPYSKKEKR